MTVQELIKNGVKVMQSFDITGLLHERERNLVEQGVIKRKFINDATLDIISDNIAYVTIDIKDNYCPHWQEVHALFGFEPRDWGTGPYSNECLGACLNRDEMLMLIDSIGAYDAESINQ